MFQIRIFSSLVQDHQTLSTGGLFTMSPQPILFADFLTQLQLLVCPVMRAKQLRFAMTLMPPALATATTFVCLSTITPYMDGYSHYLGMFSHYHSLYGWIQTLLWYVYPQSLPIWMDTATTLVCLATTTPYMDGYSHYFGMFIHNHSLY